VKHKTAFDWGYSTEERNKNVEAYEKEKSMKKVTRYRFDGHEHDYEYAYSLLEYKMFVMCNDKSRTGEFDDRCILTKAVLESTTNEIIDFQIMASHSQIDIEVLLIEELMDITIKRDDIEFVDVAIGIIDALSKKDETYV